MQAVSNTETPGRAESKAPVLKAAWDRYLQTLDDARAQIEQSPQFDRVPTQRARAYHILMEVQAVVYNHALAPRMTHPRLFTNIDWQTEVYAMSGAGPDFFYNTVFLDGAQTYRLTGQVNDSRMLLAQLNDRLPGSPGARLVRNYDFASFKIQPDGRFEVIVSAEPHDGNWIELVAGSDFQWLFFRPLMESWEAQPTRLAIERISPIDLNHYNHHEFDEAETAKRIDMAAAYARYMIQSWTVGFTNHVQRIAGGINVFGTIGTEVSGEVGSPSAEYIMGVFEVAKDEALIVALDKAPTGSFWSLQLDDIWLRSIDFRIRQTTLHDKQIAQDADGGIRIVIAHRDPGVANWLDAAGFTTGLINLRNYNAIDTSTPRITRVPLAELDAHLPAGTRRTTPDERTAELAARRAAYLRRHGE